MPEFQKLLLELGAWLEVNGEAIYDTSPWYHQNDKLNPLVWYTCKKQPYDPWRTSNVPKANDKIIAIYAIFLKWPNDNLLKINLGYYLKGWVLYLLTAGDYTAIMVNVSYHVCFIPFSLNDGINKKFSLSLNSNKSFINHQTSCSICSTLLLTTA